MRRIRSGKSVAAGDAAVFIDSACCCCYFGGASAGGAAQLSDLVTVIPEAAMSHSLTVGQSAGVRRLSISGRIILSTHSSSRSKPQHIKWIMQSCSDGEQLAKAAVGTSAGREISRFASHCSSGGR